MDKDDMVTTDQIERDGFYPYMNGDLKKIAALLEKYASMSGAEEIRIYKLSKIDPTGNPDAWFLCGDRKI